MYLFIDESKENSKKILSGLLIPKSRVSGIEMQVCDLRLKHGMFGEIAWTGVDKKHVNIYNEVVDIFSKEKSASIHSLCFRNDKMQYHAAYILIRTISWKLHNAGIKRDINVLYDNNGSLGKQEISKTCELLKKDSRFRHKLGFCTQGTSHLLACLQITDLFAGAIAAKVNGKFLNDPKKKFLEHVENANGGIPLDWSNPKLPKLGDQKVYYFELPDRTTKSN